MQFIELPIQTAISRILENLHQRDELVVQAAPGAGKTTIVPLALLDADWRKGKILLLEPRRMATRAVAYRMAELLDERVGQTVGYRIRQDTQISPNTQIEVVTPGVLLQMLQNDPSLEEYSAIIFDEFHERSVDADFALSLCLHARSLLRDDQSPLKLILMSATLDDERISAFLNHAPVIRCEGRMFPVDIIYQGECPRAQLLEQIIATVCLAHRQHSGSVLVFLPGQKEIQQCTQRLERSLPRSTAVYPLYGSLPLEQQIKAIQPLPAGNNIDRKVVLATDIAETSLTIEGVSVVVDSCVHRTPVFDTKSGMSRLSTQLCSRDSITQRAGRAGRLGPGTCYRLISQSTTLAQRSPIEILQTDLMPLALQLLNYGATGPEELQWLDAPSPSAYATALSLLQQFGAVTQRDNRPAITPYGTQLALFGTHPRLAHMMLRSRLLGAERFACFLAAVLMEPARPANMQGDLEHWETLSERTPRDFGDPVFSAYLKRVKRQQDEFLKKLLLLNVPKVKKIDNVDVCRLTGLLMVFAYPDRLARRRAESQHVYLLANGRAASLPPTNPLCGTNWLVAIETGGVQGTTEDRIYLAAPVEPDDLILFLGDAMQTIRIAEWDERAGRFIAEERRQIGVLVLDIRKLDSLTPEIRTTALSEFIHEKGLAVLSWTEECQTLCQRIQTVRAVSATLAEEFPDCSEAVLLNKREDWLTPHLSGVQTIKDLRKLDILNLLRAYITWPKLTKLDLLAPERIDVPSGHTAPIDYSQTPPALQVKLQEMFGCAETPKIVNGALPLTLHLLSPARRPLQITQDLAGFWRGSYPAVKKEMKGRYPKHPWPDDPLQATATRYTKSRTQGPSPRR